MKVTLYNQKAESVGEVDLSPKIFEVKPSLHLLAEATRIQQRNSRKGNSNTKTRGEVSGGGKKPWKQKGTGRARVGSIRSPIWRHGGVTFGPTSARNWELKMNKKAKSKALFMSLSDKAKAGNFLVVENIHLDPVKTKEFVKVVEAFKKSINNLGKNLMLVIPKSDKNLVRVSRNLSKVKTVLASSLNVVDVMTSDSMLVLKESLPVIEKTYLKIVKQA
jgi:large subunit ribosomal protein L4